MGESIAEWLLRHGAAMPEDDVEGHNSISFSVKELLIELREDIRSIDTKLELKADRDRVHEIVNDLASLRLTMTAREPLIEEFRRTQLQVDKMDSRLDEVESWRNRTLGAAGVIALFMGLITALLLYVVTHA